MKVHFGILFFIAGVLIRSSVVVAGVPVTFRLELDPAGVALQFDVVSSSSLDAIGNPQFTGTSDHLVRSATLASGAHRFVVYSATGAPVSATGEVSVTFAPSLPMADGEITIENVTASNALGVVVTSETPNALPVLAMRRFSRRSLEVGNSLMLARTVFDLDGSIKSAVLFSGSEEADSANVSPYALELGPVVAGTYALSLVATDNLDAVVTYDLGVLRAYSLDEITDYDSFAAIHFGSGTSDSDFDSDPLGNGFDNGLAYLLRINPYSADNSHLPKVAMERVGDNVELVFTFVRRSDLAGVTWTARESDTLETFSDLSASAITETDKGDGTHEVEVRIPLGLGDLSATFVNLEVSQP